MSWTLVGRPVGKNEDGKNSGAFVIELVPQGGGRPEEVGRVATERKEGHYKDVKFEDQVEVEIGKALTIVDSINKLKEHAGRLA